MALADLTYAGLKSALSDWSTRTDLNVSQIEDCVLMFESFFNRTARVRQMEESTTFMTSSGAVSLPADFIAFRSLAISSPYEELEYINATFFNEHYISLTTGTPQWWTIEADQIIVREIDDAETYQLRYWEKLPPLETAGDAGTNWLMTQYPDIYLFGSIAELYKMVRDVEAATAAVALRDQGIQQLHEISGSKPLNTDREY